MQETIDIYDANQQKVGSVERDLAHREGFWHKTFHCWIVSEFDDLDSIVFQLRSQKSAFPNMLDISAAGHFRKGEKKHHVIREVKEELGLSLAFEDLVYLGQRVEVIDFERIKNREFQEVFLIKFPCLLKSLALNSEEVGGLFWSPIKDCIRFFSKEVEHLEMSGILYEPATGQLNEVRKQVNIHQFVPRQINYYLTLSLMAERLIKNQIPVSI